MTSDETEIEVLRSARIWLNEGHRVALATVVSTWGSSPRQAGSRLAIREDGVFVGSVSAGCVEINVIREALEVLESRQPKTLDFRVSSDNPWEVGLPCGGNIQVYLEPIV